MPKLMSKSELIQKVADQHSLSKKDVKSVLEFTGIRGLSGIEEEWCVFLAGLRQVRRHQEARHQGAQRYQPVHQRTNRVQG